jgi:hypothetical protein
VRILLILSGVLLVLALIADRVAAQAAQSAVASRLQSELKLADKPAVSVHGFPFLTQLFGGRYRDVEVTAEGVTAQQFAGLTVHAHLRGLHAPFSKLTSNDIDQVPVDHVEGTVALPYDQIARATNIPGLSLSASGDSVRVAGTVTVLGQTFTASAHARAQVRDGTVIVTADHAQVQGVRLPSAVLPVVERGLSFVLPVQNLPFGLRLTGVQVTPAYLQVSAEANDVVLRKGELPTGR